MKKENFTSKIVFIYIALKGILNVSSNKENCEFLQVTRTWDNTRFFFDNDCYFQVWDLTMLGNAVSCI